MGPVIRALRVALVEAPLPRPIVVPFGTIAVRRNLLVRVETEDGGWGIGEVWANFPPWGPGERIEILTRVVRPLLVGQPLDDPVRLYRLVATRMQALANQLGAPGPFQQALAGADIALWDAAARLAGKPLADFLSGRTATKSVPVYATNLPITNPGTIEEMARRGHTRFKFRIRGDDEATVEHLREARAVSGERPVMADATQSYSLDRLRPLAAAFSELGLGWLEEPFPVDDEAAYRAWRDEPVRPPVAMGENTYREDGFARLIADIAPEIVQPDITKTGGFSEGRNIVRRILAAGCQVCLHMYGGPVGLYASAHLAAAIGEVSLLEMDSLPNPLFEMVLQGAPRVDGGRLELPAGAGLGDDLIRPQVFDGAEIR